MALIPTPLGPQPERDSLTAKEVAAFWHTVYTNFRTNDALRVQGQTQSNRLRKNGTARPTNS